ncbi:MAG: HD-GYP domain-containing protein, partial [Actinomycetota bacterium]
MRDFPLRAWLYTLAVACGAAGLVVALVELRHFGHGLETLGFAGLFLLAELKPIPIPQPSGPPISYSVSFVVAVAAFAALGPAQAAVAAAIGGIDPALRTRPDWLGRMVFNSAQLSLATALAGGAYVAAGGPHTLGIGAFPHILLPLMAASLVYFLANTSAVAGMVSLVRRIPFRQVWWGNFFSVTVTTFAFAVMGVTLAALYDHLRFAAVLFFLVPMMVARSAFVAATEMDEAYEATLRALISAIEAKDSYTRGHAERVSRLAVMIARELRMPELRVRALRIAALMHDVGKLAVSTTILTKPGKLTPEEYEHMKWHPVHGTEIVSEVDFLREGRAVEAVRHHHERMDGKGYPDGLVGMDIPLTARVVMVADAFDSMTSTRSYRPAMAIELGMAELRKWEGVQFDPRCVDALERAIQKHGWEPT